MKVMRAQMLVVYISRAVSSCKRGSGKWVGLGPDPLIPHINGA